MSDMPSKKAIYLAGSYETKILIENIAKGFVNQGFEITSRWSAIPAMENMQEAVDMDLSDIDRADVVIGFYPYGYGTSAELGYALGSGKRVIFVVDSHYLDDLPFVANSKRVELVLGHYAFDNLIDTLASMLNANN